MATGYYHKTGGARTTWSTSGNWWTSVHGTTSSGGGPNGSGQSAYIGAANMAGQDVFLSLGANISLSGLYFNPQSAYGNAQGTYGNLNSATIVGRQITFVGAGNIVLESGSPNVTIGQGWNAGDGVLLFSNTTSTSITNRSTNSLSLNDADDPFTIQYANGQLVFQNYSSGNIFIGKSFSYTPTTGVGYVRMYGIGGAGSGWTYFGNQSPYYEVTTTGNVRLMVEAQANFAFNHNRTRRSDNNTFAGGVYLYVGAKLDAWYEYLTTSPLTLDPSGWYNGNFDTLTFNGSNPITFSGTATLAQAGYLKFNILGSIFTIAGGIGNGSSPGTAYATQITKLGGGTLALLGNNSYFTSYTQDAGTTRVGNNGSLGTGVVTLNGGALSTTTGGTSFATSNNNFIINGSVTFGEAGYGGWLSIYGATTITGNSTISTTSQLFLENQLRGSATLTKTGDSNLWLKNGYGNAAPSFTGQFILNNGALFLGGFNSSTPNQLNNASSITLNGGHMQVCGNVANTFSNPISGAVDIYFRNTSAAGITFTNSQNYTGSPRLYADSAEGATTAQKWTTAHLGFSTFYYLIAADLAQNITQTIVYNGTIAAVQNSALQINAYQANRSLTAVFQNASTNNTAVTLNEAVNNFTTNAQPNQTFQFIATSGSILQNGPVRDLYTGTLNIIKSGTYDVRLGSAGTYRGSTTISQGKLIAANKTALGTGPVIVSGSLQCTDTTTDVAKLASVSSFTSSGGRLILGA
jgi:autotransporter-associated beta strand protein